MRGEPKRCGHDRDCGRTGGCGSENGECSGLRIQYLLMDGSFPAPPVVKPSQIAIASSIDVIHSGLNEHLPVMRHRRLTAHQTGFELLITEARLLADVSHIDFLEP